MNRQITNKDIRIWALVFTLLFGIIGAIQYLIWSHQRAAIVFWVLAAIFLIPGLLFPVVLKPVYKVWMKIAAGLAWFNTRLILFVVYFLVFAPVGLLLRLLGKDLIKQRWDKTATTYWIRRPETPFDPNRYEKQY